MEIIKRFNFESSIDIHIYKELKLDLYQKCFLKKIKLFWLQISLIFNLY